MQAGVRAVELPGTCVHGEGGKRASCLLTEEGKFQFCCGNWVASPENVQGPAWRGTLISETMVAPESVIWCR